MKNHPGKIRNNQALPGTKKYQLISLGFTLVEVVIVISMIALLTTVLISTGSGNIKIERFSGGVKEFSDVLRQTQVNTYSAKYTECTNPADVACGDDVFVRGNVLEFVAGSDEFGKARLLGHDLTALRGEFKQRRGIAIKRYHTDSPAHLLVGGGATLTRMWEGCNQPYSVGSNPNSYCDTSPPELSIAFLGPDGRSFTSKQIYATLDPATEPYSDERIVILELEDKATTLVGYVTFYPKSGNIDVRIE